MIDLLEKSPNLKVFSICIPNYNYVPYPEQIKCVENASKIEHLEKLNLMFRHSETNLDLPNQRIFIKLDGITQENNKISE